jgi:hypothetical protein
VILLAAAPCAVDTPGDPDADDPEALYLSNAASK